MPFPTTNTRRSLASALDRAQAQAGSIKAIAANNRTAMAAGPVTSGQLISLLDNLVGAKGVLSEAASLPGIGAYAEDQLGDATDDIAAEFTAMMDAIDAAGAWIITNFPKDGSGYLLAETLTAQGAHVERAFTSAQTAALRTLLTALEATID
jgi:hypothetical protein